MGIFPPVPSAVIAFFQPGEAPVPPPPPPAATTTDEEDMDPLAGTSFAPTVARRRPRREEHEQPLTPAFLGINLYADSETHPFFWKGGTHCVGGPMLISIRRTCGALQTARFQRLFIEHPPANDGCVAFLRKVHLRTRSDQAAWGHPPLLSVQRTKQAGWTYILASDLQAHGLVVNGLTEMFRSKRPGELGLSVAQGLSSLDTSGIGDTGFSLCPGCSAAYWTWAFGLNHLAHESVWVESLQPMQNPAAQILLEAMDPAMTDVLYSDEEEAAAQTARTVSHHAYLAQHHQQPLATDTPGSSSASSSSASGSSSASSASPAEGAVPMNCTASQDPADLTEAPADFNEEPADFYEDDGATQDAKGRGKRKGQDGRS
jgi:hypothetical protein